MLSIFLTAAALNADIIFDFTHDAIELNTYIAADKRGVSVQRAVDGVQGIRVDMKKFVKGNASWPYVATGKNTLKLRDWSNFAYMRMRVKNLLSTPIPRIVITVRDHRNKRDSFSYSLGANREFDCYIPVKVLASKMDIKNIAKVDISIPTPAADYSLRVYSVELVNSKEPQKRFQSNPDEQVGNVYDLRKDILKVTLPKQYNAVKISGTAQDTIASVKAYDPKRGGANYGFVLSAVNGALNNGDLGYMTHFSYELEAIADEKQGGYCGVTLADNHGNSMWCGIGVLGKGYPARGEHQLWDTAMQLSDMKHLAYSYSSPLGAQTYRFKKFQFEFKPSEVMRQLARWQTIVARQNLNAVEKSELAALDQRLTAAYNKVKGKTFRRGDAVEFNRLALEVRSQYRALLRKHNDRVLAPATGKVFGVGIADSMDQVFLTGPGSEIKIAKNHALSLAANESEAFQVVVNANSTTLTNAQVTVSELRDLQGNKLTAEVAPVAFAQVKKCAFPQEHTTWFPAYIREGQQVCQIAARESMPFWVRITAAAGQQPGIYSGKVKVATDQGSYEFPLQIKVWNFQLPQGSVIPQMWYANDYHYLLFYNYGTTTTLLDKAEAYRKLDDKRHYFIDKHAAYRIPYDQIYWGPSTKEYRKTYYEAVNYHNQKYGVRAYTLLTFAPPSNVKYHFTKSNDPKLQQSVKFHDAQIAKWLNYAQSLGKATQVGGYVYGFDESPMTEVSAAYFKMIREKYPQLKTASTARYGDPANPHVKYLDIQIEVAMRYINRPELVAANRAAGKQVWWYVCDYPRPPEPTLMLSVPGAVPRVFMSLMAEKYRPEGFLFWSSIYWRNRDAKNPKYKIITDPAPRISWQTDGCHPGDAEEGTLFAPAENGRLLPSLRVENFRDGVEDQWYFEVLRREMKKAGTLPPEVQAACEKALQIGNDLVSGSSHYTVDSTVIRAKRDELARCIELVRSLNK